MCNEFNKKINILIVLVVLISRLIKLNIALLEICLFLYRPKISLGVFFFEEYRFMFVKRIYVDWVFEGLKSWDQNFNIGSRLQCGKVTSLEIVMKKKF
jgi:hypothetical protein